MVQRIMASSSASRNCRLRTIGFLLGDTDLIVEQRSQRLQRDVVLFECRDTLQELLG
jgi:hypothetical protein